MLGEVDGRVGAVEGAGVAIVPLPDGVVSPAVSLATGVGVAIRLGSDVPASPVVAAGVVALPTGPAVITAVSGVAVPSIWGAADDIGAVVSVPTSATVVVGGTGVAVLSVGATAIASAAVGVGMGNSTGPLVLGCSPGMKSLGRSCPRKIIAKQSTMTKAPAVAIDGDRRRELRNHSSHPMRVSVRARVAMERGAGRWGARSWVGVGAGLVSWLVTLATGLAASVVATSAKTCFLS